MKANRSGLRDCTAMIPHRAVQWHAFVRRSRFGEEAGDLAGLVDEIKPFVLRCLQQSRFENPLKVRWKPGGPWNESIAWPRNNRPKESTIQHEIRIIAPNQGSRDSS